MLQRDQVHLVFEREDYVITAVTRDLQKKTNLFTIVSRAFTNESPKIYQDHIVSSLSEYYNVSLSTVARVDAMITVSVIVHAIEDETP